jgi:ABC-2 type transport system permease protein
MRFVANAASIAGAGGRRKRDLSEKTMRGGLTTSLVRKEWRLLLRDPLLLSQILVQLLYLLPLFGVFALRIGEEGLERFAIGGFASAFVVLATSLSASLAWLTVSAEDAPDLIAAAPVPRDEIDNAKAIAAGAPIAVLISAPAIGAAFFISAMAGVWLFIGGLCAIASACLIAIWHQAPGSRKNFRRRTRGSFLVGFGQLFVTLGWTGATALAVVGWPLFALLPALIALGALLALHESRPKPA